MNSLKSTRQKNLVWMGWSLAILLAAAGFRLILLRDVPPGLSQDEVLNADIVSFIRQGQHALFFREGFGHEPLYHYWSVPFQVLLGDNFLSIRLPAAFLGLFLVALTIRWARREFGHITALVAGLGLAISWWPIIFSRIGIRPILEPVLLVAMAWFWPKRPWLAGLFLGLSLYSYTGARVAFLIPMGWGFIQFITKMDNSKKAQQLRSAVVILALGFLVYLPLYWTLQADPNLQQRLDQLAGPLDALSQGDFGPIWQMSVATLGVFSFTGDPRWTYSLPERPLFDPVSAILFYSGVLITLLRWRKPRYALVLVWLIIAMLPSAITPQAPSTVRLVGSMPVVYLMLGVALDAIVRQLPANLKRNMEEQRLVVFSHLLLTFFAGLLFLNGARTLRDGFIRWPKASATRLEHYQSVFLDMSRYFETESSTSLVVADGYYEPIDRDSLRRNIGYDPAARWIQTGSQVAGALVIPQLEAGENGHLYVPEFAPINPILLEAANISTIPIHRSKQWPSFAVYEFSSFPSVPQLADPFTFDGRITLEGYKMNFLDKGRILQLVTLWRIEKSLPRDLTSFMHLLNKDGSLLAQYDGFDAAPAELQPGDRVIQRHLIIVPETTDPLTVQLGLYTLENQQRLGHNGTPSDFVTLTSIVR